MLYRLNSAPSAGRCFGCCNTCQALCLFRKLLSVSIAKRLLSAIVRGLVHAIEAWYGALQWQYTPAHQQHPYELVDVLAKTLLGIHPMPPAGLASPPHTVASLARSVAWDWAWLYTHRANAHAFPLYRDGWLSWNDDWRPATLCAEHLLPTEVGPSHVACIENLRLRLFSHNVQSLKGKHKLFEEQAWFHDVDVLCLQETHTDDAFIETRSYHRFAAPSAHHWGTAVWIKKRLRLGNENLQITAANLHQVIAKPRLLLVLLRVGAFTALLGSVHLPQKSRAPEERAAVLADLLGTASSDSMVRI